MEEISLYTENGKILMKENDDTNGKLFHGLGWNSIAKMSILPK